MDSSIAARVSDFGGVGRVSDPAAGGVAFTASGVGGRRGCFVRRLVGFVSGAATAAFLAPVFAPVFVRDDVRARTTGLDAGRAARPELDVLLLLPCAPAARARPLLDDECFTMTS